MNLNQVTVASINVERSVDFYKKLGLLLIVEALRYYARFECQEGNSTFSVHLVDKLKEGEGVYVYFEAKDLDEKVKVLQEAGIVFDEMPKDRKWLWREARLKDLDGNQLILYFAGDNRKNPPWRIN
ncbi:VOC family protein [Ascidiimonas sp. W6]|uniref:VOC family protein n=1 Tax=Ascidiimonas meishanensis TaxID=3128903 RepID=UPI0030EDB9A1